MYLVRPLYLDNRLSYCSPNKPNAMDFMGEKDLEGLQSLPKKRKVSYVHTDQLNFYGLGDSEEGFRIRY